MLTLSQPEIIERSPYLVVGTYCTYEGDNEGPGWAGAESSFFQRKSEISNRADDAVLGFMYRPHADHPKVDPEVRACFVGAEVTDLDHVPKGMSTTRFSGGEYVIVACHGDSGAETAEGVGAAIGMLSGWIPQHGYIMGDACFTCNPGNVTPPPYIEYVYIKIERAGL